MKRINIHLILSVIVVVGMFGANPTHAAGCTSGTLIKGTTFPAVYYCGANGKRYVIKKEKTYNTWYSDFSTVITISDADLGSISIGGNVTYKPGVRMVKVTTMPNASAVAAGGTLRWVKSEALASAYYGANWNQMIDDVPDAFFTNYKFGADIDDTSDYNPSGEQAAALSINVDKGLVTARAGQTFYPALKQEVVYFQGGGLTLTGHLCRPEGFGPFRAVIYNHGGLGTSLGGDPEGTCSAVADLGFVGFSPLRRTTMSLAGHIDDVYAALTFMKNLEYVDDNRLGIIGFSRGGLLTLEAATERTDFKAIVMMAPAPGGNDEIDTYIQQVGKINAPVLLQVSSNDTVQANHVAIVNDIHSALLAAGKEVTRFIYPPYGNDGHYMFFEIGDYWKEKVDFLTSNL